MDSAYEFLEKRAGKEMVVCVMYINRLKTKQTKAKCLSGWLRRDFFFEFLTEGSMMQGILGEMLEI